MLLKKWAVAVATLREAQVWVEKNARFARDGERQRHSLLVAGERVIFDAMAVGNAVHVWLNGGVA
jgi:hypothetical protein